MKMSNRIKISLIASACAAILTMLLAFGSTMAWFQDTEYLVNVITFGKVDVDIVTEDGRSAEDATIGMFNFLDKDGNPYVGSDFLYEPGATFVLEPFFVKNKGDVAATYSLIVGPADPESTENRSSVNLWEAMEVYIKRGDGNIEAMSSLPDERLEAGEQSESIQVLLHMKETAGNEYKQSWIGPGCITVRVFAWQDGYTAAGTTP